MKNPSNKRPDTPLTAEHFHAVDAATCKQTIDESEIQYSIDMGSFTVHHGTREGTPIVIAEHNKQHADELSGIWYDDQQ
jgi:hypothetical protein